MGFLIQRVGASSPAMILSNLRLENLRHQVHGATIAVGMLVVYGLSLIVPVAMHFDIKPTYVVGVLLGGLVFGVGFAARRLCPGTCVVGIGEGRKDASSRSWAAWSVRWSSRWSTRRSSPRW